MFQGCNPPSEAVGVSLSWDFFFYQIAFDAQFLPGGRDEWLTRRCTY